MSALDALKRVLKAAEQVERLKRQLDEAEGAASAAIATRDVAVSRVQTLRAELKQSRLTFADTLEAELPELKGDA